MCAVFILWYLPRDTQSARFLNAEEKALAYRRLQVDSSAVVGQKLDLRVALGIFKMPTTVSNGIDTALTVLAPKLMILSMYSCS